MVSENAEKSPDLNNKEIFIDRSYNNFDVIIDYLRTKRFSLKGLTKPELEDLQREVEFYNISEIVNQIAEMSKEIDFVGFESSGRYSTAGTHSIEGLKDKSLKNGICVQSPYWFTIELNY